ncbi:multidrug ABC transporter substrate-binding protein [Algimonas ampicilliniresistens]|uniref:Multidrug ABC transporter substrate-binding protein n=2 Tax=Algimonas ampicilliniresistens TaxID=1298735 RepID=A0ABQ5V5T8_9PROT|nr:multidrug ABC transporter substrate-binding protein [Algimonas ampicilliniresistens]
MAVPGLRLVFNAFGSLAERPMRTLLTMLGIIIGVAAVYTMLAIGEGTQKKILESLDGTQARSITVFPNWTRGRSSQKRPYRRLNEADLLEVRALPGVEAATGNLSREYPVITDATDWSSDIRGTDQDYLFANDFELEAGRDITETDLARKETFAVLGQTVVKNVFGGQYPVGAKIKISNVPFTVIGTVAKAPETGWSNGRDRDNFVLVPRSTLRDRLVGGDYLVRNHVNQYRIIGENQKVLDRIEEDLDAILRRSRGLSAADAPDFRVLNFSANRQQYAETQRTLSLLLATMGIVSLVVGGVGVMNIMLVSVTERTREIGLRMSLGARRSDILSQFLTEALLICILSGLIGLGVGYGVSTLGLGGDDIEMIFAPEIAILAFGSAVLVGVVFGYLPAHSASRLNPVEALRHE